MGPGVAEMAFEERKSEPVVVFMADKTSPGASNLPLFQIYANPFNTAGLVIDPAMHKGFEFEVLDVFEKRSIRFVCPEEMYELLMFIGATRRYMVKHVYRRQDGEIVASASTQKLSLIAGKYVGKDDPVLVTRCQSGSPRLARRSSHSPSRTSSRGGCAVRIAGRSCPSVRPRPLHRASMVHPG